MANDGTALGALTEIIESAGGTSDAQTLVPAIEQLGEVIGSGGGGGGIADGSVTTDKLADGAVTSDKLGNLVVTWEKINDDAVSAIRAVQLVAADSQTDQALTALGFPHHKRTPKEMAGNNEYVISTIRLCWIYNGSLEAAPISFLGNIQTGAIALYARGHDSTADGILGVDDSWTIAANA